MGIMNSNNIIKIGTRGSPLALTQARMVQSELLNAHPDLRTELVVIKTSGDWKPEDGETRLKDEDGGKGQFAKEIEAALLANDIDCAVHSMKDMETSLPEGLQIMHMLPREDARDALILKNIANNDQKISALNAGTVVGTASVRRQALLLARNPNLKITPLRGNVQTRLDKLDAGQVDATLLAYAGLKRLGLETHASWVIDIDEMVPAAGQGAVGIETRTGDLDMHALLNSFNCINTLYRVQAERAVLAVLDGSCHTPIGVHATLTENHMCIQSCIASLDGKDIFEDTIESSVHNTEDAIVLGDKLGKAIKATIPPHLLTQKINDE